MVHIALDAMGGDHAPREILVGAWQATQEFSVKVTVIGPQDTIRKELAALGYQENDLLCVYHASEVVDMSESPVLSFRKKKDSSIRVGLNLLKEKKVDGFISAGNTGAVMSTATLVLGKIPNIDRPAIATIIPSKKGPVVMLDMGSTVDSKPTHIEQFSVMGNCFSKSVLGVATPRVALLNIGEETEKGNQLVQQSYELLEKAPIHFVGNVEGKDILAGKADVVVCDGFVGNSLLKFGEGVAELFFTFFEEEWNRSIISKLGLILLRPSLRRFKQLYNYEERGSAPLLGVNGATFISHGKSKAYAIKNGIKTVKQAIETQMIETLSHDFATAKFVPS